MALNVEQVINEARFNRFHVLLVVLGYLVIIVEGYDLMIYGGTLSVLMEEWAVTPFEAGILGGLAPCGMALGALFFGRVADKVGRKNVLLISLLLFSVITVLAGFSTNVVMFGVCRFVSGLGIGGTPVVTYTLMSEYAPARNKAFVVGSVASAFMLGGLLASLVNMWLTEAIGWHAVYFVAAIPIVILTPIIYRFVPDSPLTYLKKGREAQLRAILRKIRPDLQITDDEELVVNAGNVGKSPVKALFVQHRALSTIAIWLLFFICQYITYSMTNWLPKLMINQGYAYNSGMFFLLILNLGGWVGTQVASLLADRFGHRRIISVTLALAAICFLAMPFAPGTAFQTILIVLSGAGFFSASSLMFAYSSLFYPSDIRSTGGGFASGFGRLGSVSGPVIMGALMGMFLPASLYFYLMALPLIVGCVLLALVQERYGDFYGRSAR